MITPQHIKNIRAYVLNPALAFVRMHHLGIEKNKTTNTFILRIHGYGKDPFVYSVELHSEYAEGYDLYVASDIMHALVLINLSPDEVKIDILSHCLEFYPILYQPSERVTSYYKLWHAAELL